ncbi:MAG: AbrB/MazE/SpoVT family DNA-binding domain-containing protein [Thaumarchaeota archaeon]|nr:AbrB/MazE/SpoVT family DNA-binding domain-containing protein [Nitrososphaerota archaeon]
MQIRKLYSLGSGKTSVCCIIPREVLQATGLSAGDYVKIKAAGKFVVIEPVAEVSGEEASERVEVSTSGQS